MKIIQANKAYGSVVGGVETTVTNLAEGLSRKEGASVSVLACGGRGFFGVRRETINGVRVTFVPSLGTVASLPISPLFPFVLAGVRGDILHVHGPFPWADFSVLMMPGILRNVSRLVVSWHGDVVRQKWALACYRPMVRRFLQKADSILVSSPVLIESSEYLPANRDRCEVIPHGVQLGWIEDAASRRAAVEQIRQKHGTPLILFVGRLVYYKGLPYLLEAMSRVTDASLVIIGSGALRSQLERQIAALGLGGRVTIIPHVEADELHAFYEACDLLVLPSTDRSESYGLVQIEAMACGKPVVSTNLNTGVPFVNQHGVTGLTVPVRDSEALAGALSKLIADEALRRTLGKNGRDRALREFSAETMVDRTFALYQRLLAR